MGNVLPVNPDLAYLGFIEAQKQRNQRGFAGAAGPNNPQLFARRDPQVDVLDATNVATIGKTDAIKFNGGPVNCQITCIVRIIDPHPGGQRANTVFDFPDIGVNRHKRETDPTGHLRNADGNRSSGHYVACTDLSVLPQQQRTANQHNGQDARQGHQRIAERCR